MLKFIIISFLISNVLGCNTSKVKLFDQCEFTKSISIKLKTSKFTNRVSLLILVANHHSETILLSKPTCYSNVHLQLFEMDGRSVPYNLRIRPDLDCRRTFAIVKANEVSFFLYDFMLSELFLTKPKSSYKLKLVYDGFVKNSGSTKSCPTKISCEQIIKIE